MQTRVENMEKSIVGQLQKIEQLTVKQKDYEAMEKEVALITEEREDLRKKVEAEEKSSLGLEVSIIATVSRWQQEVFMFSSRTCRYRMACLGYLSDSDTSTNICRRLQMCVGR